MAGGVLPHAAAVSYCVPFTCAPRAAPVAATGQWGNLMRFAVFSLGHAAACRRRLLYSPFRSSCPNVLPVDSAGASVGRGRSWLSKIRHRHYNGWLYLAPPAQGVKGRKKHRPRVRGQSGALRAEKASWSHRAATPACCPPAGPGLAGVCWHAGCPWRAAGGAWLGRGGACADPGPAAGPRPLAGAGGGNAGGLCAGPAPTTAAHLRRRPVRLRRGWPRSCRQWSASRWRAGAAPAARCGCSP